MTPEGAIEVSTDAINVYTEDKLFRPSPCLNLGSSR